jgi:hypothetical protein
MPDPTKLWRSALVRIAQISQIQTFVRDAALQAGLANICHTRGIEMIEAMPKPSVDIERERAGADRGASFDRYWPAPKTACPGPHAPPQVCYF